MCNKKSIELKISISYRLTNSEAHFFRPVDPDGHHDARIDTVGVVRVDDVDQIETIRILISLSFHRYTNRY